MTIRNYPIIRDYPNFATHLQRANGRRLEPQISFEILSDLPDQTLEWEFADKQLRRLLVPGENNQK